MSNSLNSTTTTKPRQKVVAAAGGSGVASALSVLLLWMLKTAGISLPTNVEEAIATVFIAIVTFICGYYMPPGAAETTIVQNGAPKSAVMAN